MESRAFHVCGTATAAQPLSENEETCAPAGSPVLKRHPSAKRRRSRSLMTRGGASAAAADGPDSSDKAETAPPATVQPRTCRRVGRMLFVSSVIVLPHVSGSGHVARNWTKPAVVVLRVVGRGGS